MRSFIKRQNENLILAISLEINVIVNLADFFTFNITTKNVK